MTSPSPSAPRVPLVRWVFVFVLFALLMSLGVWQLQRLAWKEKLIADIEAGMKQPPIIFTGNYKNPKDLDHRAVVMTGRYLTKHGFYVRPRTNEAGMVGGHVVMPFLTVTNKLVFVNRGWYSQQTLKTFSQSPQVTTVKGTVVFPDDKNYPPNNPATGEWYRISPHEMAVSIMEKDKATIIKSVTPFIVTLMPVKAPEIVNNHLQYAIFWFSMAAILLVVFMISLRGRG